MCFVLLCNPIFLNLTEKSLSSIPVIHIRWTTTHPGAASLLLCKQTDTSFCGETKDIFLAGRYQQIQTWNVTGSMLYQET